MWKKATEWLAGIGSDRLLHVIAGIMISEVMFLICASGASDKTLPFAAGWMTAAVAGYVKEAWDSHHGEDGDLWDVVATAAGGTAGMLVMLLTFL